MARERSGAALLTRGVKSDWTMGLIAAIYFVRSKKVR